jgi:DNA-binding transcriptional regulator YhcF (GntR family)
MDKEEFQIFLARSKLRQIVYKKLQEKPQIASFLAKELKKHRESISRVFKDMERIGLVKCLNKEDPHFRKYSLVKK